MFNNIRKYDVGHCFIEKRFVYLYQLITRRARSQNKSVGQRQNKMEITNDKRTLNILNKAIKIGFELDESLSIEELKEKAISYLIENTSGTDEECDIITGNHGQSAQWTDGKGYEFFSQGEIVDFTKHWFDPPKTKVFYETLVDSEANVIKLYYLVGETEYNMPEDYYYSRKEKRHLKI